MPRLKRVRRGTRNSVPERACFADSCGIPEGVRSADARPESAKHDAEHSCAPPIPSVVQKQARTTCLDHLYVPQDPAPYA